MLRLRRWLRNLFVRWRVGERDRCRRCGGRIRCRVRFRFLFRRGRRRFSWRRGGGGCGRCRRRRCRRSRRLRPGYLGLVGGFEGGKGWTYDCGGDAHVCEFLHVFGAGFCAVVRDEDYLLAWRSGQGKAAVGEEISTLFTQDF